MVIQAHLHVGSFTVFYIKRASLKRSIRLSNCCNQGQLLNKKVIMKCLAIKIFAWNFLQLPIQKI